MKATRYSVNKFSPQSPLEANTLDLHKMVLSYDVAHILLSIMISCMAGLDEHFLASSTFLRFAIHDMYLDVWCFLCFWDGPIEMACMRVLAFRDGGRVERCIRNFWLFCLYFCMGGSTTKCRSFVDFNYNLQCKWAGMLPFALPPVRIMEAIM